MLQFENKEALAQALATAVAQALSKAITEKGKAVLAVSGGTTPQRFFECLAHEDITWEKVVVTLVDERQVDETSPRSNAALVKARLMSGRAKPAQFVPLHRNVKEAETLTPDVVVLGMGTDGHTASFFPGGDRLKHALDLANRDGVIAIEAPGAGEPRLTFYLARLLQASKLFLHIEGRDKLAVLEKARSGDDVFEMPIRAVLKHAPQLKIFWCP